ncbi:50S ribosomal protein L25 [Francisella tularensis subsp. tularensis 79201237]|uniref:50S ribosomal protein L25 n=1 Tax=Francisella tularensis TaxID=263 RepID=UPI00028E3180|nr:50S ribosomal protein L25 [Francisella tularensis]EKM88702.1 50S ribosomal protein L25 [Francisella tularensis subsp. tularensis 80700075]EOA42519.1 50S ribosomal protein L25 [Francisella tularensis subsp. tularensis 80700075]EOA43931.1 50S ribosomal protein L25 [Francisella tularensis subsp. tularensis 79201237]EOA44535.1 50S ribosomal protein L25 [Francisella tularensis subsp. tularensis 80700069]
MANFVLKAEKREDLGTGASRRLRRAGKIPAVIYGGEKEAVSVLLDHDKVIHSTEDKAFFSSEITLDIDGKQEKVIIKALQRHPYKVKLIHADFMRV